MTEELTSTTGLIAVAATVIGVVALCLATVAVIRLRRVVSAQTTVLGDGERRDLIAHSQHLQEGFVALRELVDSTFTNVEARFSDHARRLDQSVCHVAVIRYDAYGEMSGRQSSSMALLDEHGDGLVLSSILHRDQARMYVKDVQAGSSQYDLSPEENEAIATAMKSHGGKSAPAVANGKPQS